MIEVRFKKHIICVSSFALIEFEPDPVIQHPHGCSGFSAAVVAPPHLLFVSVNDFMMAQTPSTLMENQARKHLSSQTG